MESDQVVWVRFRCNGYVITLFFEFYRCTVSPLHTLNHRHDTNLAASIWYPKQNFTEPHLQRYKILTAPRPR